LISAAASLYDFAGFPARTPAATGFLDIFGRFFSGVSRRYKAGIPCPPC
jgi:hypothetical protein